ncbi:hypothetical protein HDR60_02920 [bacterium]|nr:hypothetical protein [bacterium]
MKKITIYVLVLCISTIGFTRISLSVTRPSVRRAGQMGKNTQKQSSSSSNTKAKAARSATTARAATGTNARAASTTRSASSKRANSLSARRNAASKKTSSSETSSTNNTTCPIGVVIKKMIDDNGNEVLYSDKETVCTEPENVMGTSVLDNLTVPTWMAGKYAYVFNCNYGYVKTINDNVDVCVDQNTICPLNTTVKYENDKYYNPYTNQECNLPAYASALKLTEELNTNGNIATDNAYYTYCNKNYYTLSNAECKACPTGKYTVGTQIKFISTTDADGKVTGQKRLLVGDATSENDCYKSDEVQSIKWDENGNMSITRSSN